MFDFLEDVIDIAVDVTIATSGVNEAIEVVENIYEIITDD